MTEKKRMNRLRLVLGAQGVYYILTGLWPLFSMRTFELITGPKRDDFLVHMVGALAAAVGLALLVAALSRSPSIESVVLGIASAVAFAGIDLFYGLQQVLPAVYLVEAIVEIGIIALLALAAWRARASLRGPDDARSDVDRLR